MLSSQLIKGLKCKLEVVTEKSHGNYYFVKTADNEEFQINKLKFQKDNNLLPDWLDVYVKESHFGYVELGQNLAVLISKFYKEGEEYRFRVKGKKPNGTKWVCEVEDDNGFSFLVPNAPTSLPKGKLIKCKVNKIKGSFVYLQYAGQLDRRLPIPFLSIEGWLEAAGTEDTVPPLEYLMSLSPDFDEVLTKMGNKEVDWIMQALSTFSQNITKYLILTKNDRNLRNFRRLLQAMGVCNSICLYIIQGSDCLKECNSEQRAAIQERLSGYVEQFSQIAHAADLIAQGKEEAFIDNILNNLKQAGYLYRPSEQFRVMMTILRLRPELISDDKDREQTSRITLLFEALHSWPVTNWREEPFRSALVDQLEIFISENTDKLNSIALNDSGADNRQTNRIIRAISIQSILAKPSDRVDLAHNKVLLYRLLASFNSYDTESLLYKAVGAILGNLYTNDFYWDDTSRIQLLQEKASRYSDNLEDFSTQSKVFSSGPLIVELHPRELIVRTKYATEDSSVLPNDLIGWMKPKIYLQENIKTPSASRKNDLKAFRTMWADIENGIFKDSDPNSAAKREARKQLPEDGEDVEIIIDDFDIDPVYERMRFHCRIVDDYHYGSGWLAATSDDFLPWLDYRDYPINYNGDLNIFRSSDGAYLRYRARAVNVDSSGKNIRFTMKKEIEDYITYIPEMNEESHAVVRYIHNGSGHKNYPHYLCLSDNGYTVKLPLDATDGLTLEVGNHILVRYTGRDHSSSNNVFMTGEFAGIMRGDQYGKLTPLRNLMQGMGEPVYSIEESGELEVVEAQQVMSREELLQFVLMLQRRAYSEKEYIQAFNYLGLGALLCRAIDDNNLYNEMRLHQDLLTHLQFYARNKKVDFVELEKYRDRVEGHAILKKLYTKLEIVAAISRPETNLRLWEISAGDDETERMLSRLVLSYNLLPDEGFEAGRKEIMGSISSLLNVNSNDAILKYYGEEDQNVEFKSSLIFTNKKKDHMQARPEEQTHEILEIICGFLNSKGGTLYIGVNDLGYEAGLLEDIRYREWKGKKSSPDAMLVDLNNAIHEHFPGDVADAIETDRDTDASKVVLRVKVNAMREPVALDGTYFVRNGTSTRPRLGADLESFLKNRADNYDRWMLEKRRADAFMQADMASQNAQQEQKGQASETAEIKPKESSTSHTTLRSLADLGSLIDTGLSQSESADDAPVKAETGAYRLNVLHEYEEMFVHPAYYLHFNADHTYYATTEDLWTENEPDKVAVLAVRNNEIDKTLVAAFDDGTVTTAGLEELNSATGTQPGEYVKNASLRFVDIASPDDYLITYLRNGADQAQIRADRVGDLSHSYGLRLPGKRLHDHAYTVEHMEICPAAKARDLYAKAIDIASRQLGYILKIGPRQTIDEAISVDVLRIGKETD